MWIKEKDGSIINTDCIESIKIYEDFDPITDTEYDDTCTSFEIRAYTQSYGAEHEEWFTLRILETREEAEQKLEELQKLLNSKQ